MQAQTRVSVPHPLPWRLTIREFASSSDLKLLTHSRRPVTLVCTTPDSIHHKRPGKGKLRALVNIELLRQRCNRESGGEGCIEWKIDGCNSKLLQFHTGNLVPILVQHFCDDRTIVTRTPIPNSKCIVTVYFMDCSGSRKSNRWVTCLWYLKKTYTGAEARFRRKSRR